MSTLFAYSLAVSLVLIPLYLTLRLCVAGITYHGLSRISYIFSLLATLLVPVLAEPVRAAWTMAIEPSMQAAGATVAIGPMSVEMIEGTEHTSTPLWLRMAVIVYMTGLIFFVAREIIGAIRLYNIIHGAKQAGKALGRWQILVHASNVAGPFSFGRYIIMSEQDYAVADNAVLTHESAHLAGRHWADLILATGVALLCWYCPAGWLMRRDLATVHEYEADDAVLRSGARASDYQIMLIKKAAGSRFPSIACNLTYHSNISKRIKMMLKQKSSPSSRIMAAVALPVAALCLLALSAPAVANALTAVSDAKVTDSQPEIQTSAPQIAVADNEGSLFLTIPEAEADPVEVVEEAPVASAPIAESYEAEKPVARSSKDEPQDKKAGDSVFDAVEKMPEYEGGEAAMFQFIAKKLRYPKDAEIPGFRGRSIIRFVVEKDGSVNPDEIEVLRSAGKESCDNEAKRVASMLRFKSPGMVNGKPVRVHYVLPFMFKVTEDDAAPADTIPAHN
ncbi:MAG: M56 family metallopeptidase [Pseudoflavonifractor sp.]|nr:M56 family metallopeptidase [Alloprevotella sp.]MCM1116857.1 M56 family metallopeptidase [Pseudoflavonifractor sp.]